MKTIIIIMSAISILDLLFATFFGLWIHDRGGFVVDGTSLLEVHIIQGLGTVIITAITFGLIAIRKGKMKMITILLSLLSTLGLVVCLLSGWLVYQHVGIITAIARRYDFHEIQVISTVILTIVVLIFSIIRECDWKKKPEMAAIR